MKKRFLCFTLICLLILTAVAPAVQASSGNSVVADSRNGVVRVYCENGVSADIGSAFGVGTIGEATDIFVTNRHVLCLEDEFGNEALCRKIYLAVDGNPINGRVYAYVSEYFGVQDYVTEVEADTARLIPCDIIYESEERDIAILKATRVVEGRTALELAESAESALPGEQVYALGYPASSDSINDTDWVATGEFTMYNNLWCEIFVKDRTYSSFVDDVTVTTGTVSRLTEYTAQYKTKIIQHDAQIHSGNSGGPLINAQGQVLGVNTYSSEDASRNYAVFIDYVREALDEVEIPYNVSSHRPSTNDKEEDPTETETETTDDQPNLVIIGGGAAAALILIAVAVFLILKNRKPPVPVNEYGDIGTIDATVPVTDGFIPPLPLDSDFTPRFQGINGVYSGQRFAINGTVRIGRNPEANDLIYPADTQGVSGIHCVLTFQNGHVYLQDLGSTFGTFLGNGQKLAPSQTVQLQISDRFYLGSPNEMFVITPNNGV